MRRRRRRGTVGAAPPDHGATGGSFVDPDVCGTGIAVTVHERAHTGILSISVNDSGVATITYEPTGNTATVEYRGQSKGASVVDNGDGTVTIQAATVGLPGRVTLLDGSVRFHDRGRIVCEFVIDLTSTPLDASNDIFVEDYGMRFQSGPHPRAGSDVSLFCDVLPDALTAA